MITLICHGLPPVLRIHFTVNCGFSKGIRNLESDGGIGDHQQLANIVPGSLDTDTLPFCPNNLIFVLFVLVPIAAEVALTRNINTNCDCVLV